MSKVVLVDNKQVQGRPRFELSTIPTESQQGMWQVLSKKRVATILCSYFNFHSIHQMRPLVTPTLDAALSHDLQTYCSQL